MTFAVLRYIDLQVQVQELWEKLRENLDQTHVQRDIRFSELLLKPKNDQIYLKRIYWNYKNYLQMFLRIKRI